MMNTIEKIKGLDAKLKKLTYERFAVFSKKTGSAESFSEEYLQWRDELRNLLIELGNRKALDCYHEALPYQDVDDDLVKPESFNKAVEYFKEALEAAMNVAQKKLDEQIKIVEDQKNIVINDANKKKCKNHRIYVSYGGEKKYLDKLKKVFQLSFSRIEYDLVEPKDSDTNQDLPIINRLTDKIRNGCDGAIFYITDAAYTQNDGKVLTNDALLEIGGIVGCHPEKYILIVDGDLDLPPELDKIANEFTLIRFNSGIISVDEALGLTELLNSKFY